MPEKIYIIGIGPGGQEHTLPVGMKLIQQCDILVGGKRNLQPYSSAGKEQFILGNNLEQAVEFIKEKMAYKKVAVLVSGDPGLYSMLGFIKKNISEEYIEIIPGISSLQYLFCRMKTAWDDIKIASVHGRKPDNLLEIIAAHKRVALFTGGELSPRKVCKLLLENGLDDKKVTVGENLSYENERLISGTPCEIAAMDFEALSVMVIEDDTGNSRKDMGNESEDFEKSREGIENTYDSPKWPFRTPGIPDNMFIRGNIPMTKQEVRTVALSMLRLRQDDVVYDVGAGTGSITVEAALQCPKGRVYAIEREEEGIRLIKENVKNFGLYNVDVIHGEAPVALEPLPVCTRVFIGGSGGYLNDILDTVAKKVRASIRIVVNSITLETTLEAVKYFEERGFDDIHAVNLAVTSINRAGRSHMMLANNPIFIIAAEKA